MVKRMENPIKMDNLGGNTPIFGNTHMFTQTNRLSENPFSMVRQLPETSSGLSIRVPSREVIFKKMSRFERQIFVDVNPKIRVFLPPKSMEF